MCRTWLKYFPPTGRSDLAMQVPKNQAPFFMSNLLSPRSFQWTKKFLASKALLALMEPVMESLSFALPQKCPLNDKSSCFTIREEDPLAEDTNKAAKISRIADILEQSDESSSMLTRECQVSSVDTELRRSLRLKKINPMFKNEGRLKKNCLMCAHDSSSSLTMSVKVIRNLATQFCSIDPQQTKESVLHKKRQSVAPVQPPIGQSALVEKDKSKWEKKTKKSGNDKKKKGQDK